jgi:mannitol-specific phosphotransferase system IIBC component
MNPEYLLYLLIASTGSRIDAKKAGIIPATIPTTTLTTTPIIALFIDMTISKSASFAIRLITP